MAGSFRKIVSKKVLKVSIIHYIGGSGEEIFQQKNFRVPCVMKQEIHSLSNNAMVKYDIQKGWVCGYLSVGIGSIRKSNKIPQLHQRLTKKQAILLLMQT